jgi:hypothetical protein
MPRSPYVGLDPYSEKTAAYFFGREDDVRLIIANLRSGRLTLVYGESGVGKSSLLNAGVAPELRRLSREALTKEARPNMLVTVFGSWRDDPARDLTDAVYESLRDLIGERAGPRAPPSQPLPEALSVYSERLGGTLLVVLDQF